MACRATLRGISRAHVRAPIDRRWERARAIEKKSHEIDRHRLSPDQGSDIAINMRNSRYDHAIRKWVSALNERGSKLLSDAVHPDIVVDRIGFGSKRGTLVQTMKGAPAVAEWIGITPAGVRFEVAGPVVLDPDMTPEAARTRYRLSIADIVGGGQWTYRIHDDGRVVWLEHAPDEIADPIEEGDHLSGSTREHHDHPHHEGHQHHH